MNERFGPYNDDRFNKTIFHIAIVVKDKGWKVSSDSNICVIKIDYWKGCICVKKGLSLFDCKWMYLCQAISEW
jgi:hypothetical protein